MADVLRFTVPGEPVAWQRRGTRGGRSYTPPKTREFQARVAKVAAVAVTRAGWTFPETRKEKQRFGIRVNVFRKYLFKGGDLSNYIKSIEDGCNKAKVVWPDDARVHGLEGNIIQDAQVPRTVVAVWKL